MNRRIGCCGWVCVAAILAVACSEDANNNGPSKCAGVVCVEGTACNPDTGICDPIGSDKCAGVICPAKTECNPDTGNCDPVTDKCAGVSCPAKTECNPDTGNCDPVADKCEGVSCPPNSECNPDTGACDPIVIDKCEGVSCSPNTECNPDTGICDPIVIDKCAGVSCPSNTECNPATGACDPVADKCEGVTCPDNTICNHSTGHCDPVGDGCVGGCNENWEVCMNGACVNKNCIGVSCRDWEYCSITGKCYPWPGNCNTDEDCDGETCNLTTHTCGLSCEDETEGNIVPNWNFAETEGSGFKFWSLENSSDYANGILERSDDAYACTTAANLINRSTSNARLISDVIHLPEMDYTGGNEKFDCTVYVKGEGTISVGYRTLKSGETNKYDYKYSPEGQSVDNSDYRAYTFEMSLPAATRETQVIVAAKSTTLEGMLIDAFTCERKNTKCTGKVCDSDWQICAVNKKDSATGDYGACVAKPGFCDTDSNCAVVETCNTTTHLCEATPGKCADHEDCADGDLKFCDTKTHTCVAGDPCDNVTCDEWKQCNARTGKCVLKEGRCFKSSDCLKDKPACYAATHTCVETDFTYPVSSANECRRTGYNKDTKQCPVNVVLNGGFEAWEDVTIGSSTKTYHLPVSWYGLEFDVAPTHYDTELDANLVHAYTSNPHSGNSALQIEFTKAVADRFTSEGFSVPGGTFDCAYWVRGKGDVRMHSYSSRGDAEKTEYVSYDTSEWVRVPFVIKESASAMRLIFYISHTDAAKDHIQIDDVVCTSYHY